MRTERKLYGVAGAMVWILDHVVQDENECWVIKGAMSYTGGKGINNLYPNVPSSVQIKGRSERSAHRIMWLAHKKLPDGHHVLHKCDNTHCVNLVHLFTGTPKDNMEDRDAKGRDRFSKERVLAKLKWQNIAINRRGL